MGWEAERAEDAYWMHGPNWPFDDSDYGPDLDEETQPVPDDPQEAEHLDEIMDAFHGLPDGTTRRVRQRAERARHMRYQDELAKAEAKDRARDLGHGGWQPGRTHPRNDHGVMLPAALGFATARQLFDALTSGVWAVPEPARFPSEPPEGSVLKWVKTFKRNPEQGYTYVALHINGAWYLTGKRDEPITWDELVALIGDSPCELATNWVEIPQPKKNDLDGLSPEEWFLLAFPQDVVDSDQGQEG